jgi:hypothetical protein
MAEALATTAPDAPAALVQTEQLKEIYSDAGACAGLCCQRC